MLKILVSLYFPTPSQLPPPTCLKTYSLYYLNLLCCDQSQNIRENNKQERRGCQVTFPIPFFAVFGFLYSVFLFYYARLSNSYSNTIFSPCSQ